MELVFGYVMIALIVVCVVTAVRNHATPRPGKTT